MNPDRTPTVSIGLPVYNGGAHLKVAVDLLLSQDFDDLELIISDNASTDGTEELCRSYATRDARVRYIRRDRNYGMIDNGKNVIGLARGRYYLPASHDDEWLPGAVRACVERLEANPALVLVSPAIEFFRPDGTALNLSYPPLRTVGMGIRDRVAALFKENNIGYNIYGMYRLDQFRKVNFDVPCYACDVVFLLQLMFLGEADHLPEKLFRYCFVVKTPGQHVASLSNDLRDKNPTRLYTILTINLLRAVFNAAISPAFKRVLISDILQIVAVKNQRWRQILLAENPGIIPFVEPAANGFLPSRECNLLSAFAALLLPYCYAGAPYEGAIDFSESEGFEAIPGEHRAKPTPGHAEYTDTLACLLNNRLLAQALAFHDEFRPRQPATEPVARLSATIDSIRPKPCIAFAGGPPSAARSNRLRIVFQQGRNGSPPGLDSLIRQQLQARLTELGHEVMAGADLPGAECDIVHGFALTDSREIEGTLNRALNRRVPLAITTLLDDSNRYRVKAGQWLSIFKRYLEQGQQPLNVEQMLREALPEPLAVPGPSALAARYAHRLIAGGPTEARLLETLFPGVPVSVVPVGVSGITAKVPGTVFEKEYGVKNFVLCVADLETINNQLMLLRALEHEEIPVVLIHGGNAGEQPYAALCARMRRKGPSILVPNPSAEMLLSAYQAARVFCIPSWSDRTGLATLEAAFQGCAVVASRWGCVSDYLGDACEYCEPNSPGSVRSAVLRAFKEGPKPGLKELSAGFTWEAAAKKLEAVYRELVRQKCEATA